MDLNPAGDRGSKDVDKVLSTVSFAYNKERATSSSPFIDSILHNAHLFVLFAVYLICRYVNHVSLYQVLVCVGLTPLFLYFYINYAPLLFLEEDIKWIRREWGLLHAIVEDAKKIMEYRGLIGARACKIWDSNPDGATVKGVDETEVAWLKKAKSIVLQAENLVETFEKQRIRRDSHTQRLCFDMITENFQQVTELFTETKTVKQEMKDIVEENKVYGIGIGESLERSRSSIVSLLDRPLDGHDQQKWVKSKEQVSSAAALASTVVENIKRLTIRKPDLTCKDTGDQISSIDLQLQQLHHFLKDIEGIRFESEIEGTWVKEVHEMIKEADHAVNKYWQRIGRLSFINNWNAGRKLKGDIKCIDVGFTQLLERKDSYGFKFVRRDSSKFVYQSPQQTQDDSIISTILSRMHEFLTENSHLLGEVLYELTSLYNQLEKMHKLVRDASVTGGGYNSRMSWLEQARKISESAEKSLTTFQRNSHNMWQNLLFKTRAGRKFSRDVHRINHTIDLFLKCIRAYDIEVREEPNSVVGLEEDIEAVVSQLTTNDEHPSVISIVGIGGIGKTTLAKKIYDHGVVVDHFPCRAWVSVPQKSDNSALLEDVAKQVLRSLQLLEEENRNGSWIQKAYDVLKDKRYLLVLDNISIEKEFDTLKAGFPVTSTGRKILLTTRDDKEPSPKGISPHKLRLRTKEESWQLFTQMVHFPPTEELLAKDIFRKCGGLPQAIFHVGYLMFGKDASMAEETKRVLTYIKQNDTPLLATLTITPMNLPDQLLIKCLSYFKLFPNDFEIPARRLTTLWIAEGLVGECKPEETDEDVAHKYLSELIHRDMIQVVKRKHNGEVKICRLPYALQKVELQDMSKDRLIDHYSKSNESFAHIHGDSANFPNEYRRLVSIISFDTREGNKPGEEIGNFLRRGIAGGFFHRLQVLDLERVFRPELPNTIGKLKKLRYLSLRWTFLGSVPASIGELLNLQTLDVKHTDVQTLPSSIWKLQKLRHLYLNQSYQSKFMHQQGGSSLKNLRTLWGVFLDKDSPLIHWIDKLINLRKLGLAFQLSLPEQQPLAAKIGNLKNLQSLRIRSRDEMGEPCDLICVNLSNLESLSSLNLFGKLDNSMIAKLPKNLTDLTLSGAFLSVDPMPMLEKLSNLKFLNFYSNSYTGIDMVCSTTGFPKLVVLKLWKLQNLTDWKVEEKAMQNLRELEIRACTNLKVPSGLRHLKNLTLLKLTNMPEEFSATIAITKAQIWDDIAHSPAVITDSW